MENIACIPERRILRLEGEKIWAHSKRLLPRKSTSALFNFSRGTEPTGVRDEIRHTVKQS
jgi:hypothetical protein